MKIKVLQVIGTLRIGGAENMAMNILRYLDKNKYQCDFLVFNDNYEGYEEEAVSLGANIIRINKPSDSYVKFYNSIKDILRKGEYDIVHSHTLLNNGIVLKAAFASNIKIRISHSHSTKSGKHESLLYKIYSSLMKNWINKYSTHIIACGSDAGNFLYGEKHFNKNGYIMKNGVDIDKYLYEINNDKRIRDEFLLDNKFIIGHVGRFASVKNHEFLIEVFFEVQKHNPNIVLILIGDGELFNQVREKVKKLNLEDKIILTGTRDDVNTLLQAVDLFVLPSLYEGLPVSVIEAQAAGLNCIISDVITDEVCVTDNVMKLPLNKQSWVEEILMQTFNRKRYNARNELVNSGYYIKDSVKSLMKIYDESH